MLPSTLAGFGLGLSLIVAIGAQNLFVLRQGIRREHVLTVALVCAVSDAVLIVVGVSGLGLALDAVPWLVDVVRWAGFAFLLVYGLLAARRALRPSGAALTTDAADGPRPRDPGAADAPRPSAARATMTRTRLTPVLLTCLALTWLNPHVYLDTVFLLGSVASTHGDHRWWFAAGASLASVVWFFGLAFGARFLGRWLATPRAWRILDGVIAVVMIAIAISLVWPAS
ncbi:L-lysine exporter [Microbacterium lacticum]